MLIWLRAVRIRFLSSSLIATLVGLAISWSRDNFIDPGLAIMTLVGVLSLHASVDLLNDYTDYESGLDLLTKRTPFSGGSGVLPERLLSPKSVLYAGLAFLTIGAIIGIVLTIMRGWVIGLLLVFAVVSTIFYSSKLANIGLGEIVVVFKGAFIVLGTYYVQTLSLSQEPFLMGVVLGILSSTVLFVNEFPDFKADTVKRRLNIVVRMGMEKAGKLFFLFPLTSYLLLLIGIALGLFPILTGLTLALIPLYFLINRGLRSGLRKPEGFITTMSRSVIAGRLYGLIILAAYLVT
ncbi:MAG: prenyltransferase [Nitrososphaerales archaeon]